MPHKNSPRQQTPNKNIFKDCSNRTGYYSAEGVAYNPAAESRMQSFANASRGSRELAYGKNQDAYITKEEVINGTKVKSRIRIPDVIVTARDLKTDLTKSIFNRDHQLMWTRIDKCTASQKMNEIKRIEKRCNAS